MIQTATNPAEAADMVKQYKTPLQIIIPKRANMRNFIATMRAYLLKYNLVVSVSNASTKQMKVIYISQKGSIK